jgi:hypothetical protein
MELPECERKRYEDLIPFCNRMMDEGAELRKERDETREWICRIARRLDVPCPENVPEENIAQGWKRWMTAIETKVSA